MDLFLKDRDLRHESVKIKESSGLSSIKFVDFQQIQPWSVLDASKDPGSHSKLSPSNFDMLFILTLSSLTGVMKFLYNFNTRRNSYPYI